MKPPDRHMPFALTVDNLTVKAPRGRVLLQVQSFSARPGEAIGLRGPSGAGKSTFLYALAGLHKDMSGRVIWQGTDLAALTDSARTRFRREHIGMIFQDYLLFEELSALDNAALAAAFGRKDGRAGIFKTAGHYLRQLGVPSGKRTVDSFSGGERQRTAVARALAHDPAILLADEPTASLDRETADRLADDLIALARTEQKTLMVASHDQHLLAKLDRVTEIVDGRLVMEAAPV